MSVLITERLELAPIDDAHLPGILALLNEPRVARYLLDGRGVSEDWVRNEIRSSQARFEGSSAGLWALRRRIQDDTSDVRKERAGAMLGIVGYRPFFEPPELQLLYALHPSAWGEGLATEAGGAALEHAFTRLDLDEVGAATDAPNEASIRVLERLGMSRWKTTPGEPWDTVFFRIDRQAWNPDR